MESVALSGGGVNAWGDGLKCQTKESE
jgi:hypothetical protein